MSVCCTYRNGLQRPTDTTTGVRSRRRGCMSVAIILVSFVMNSMVIWKIGGGPMSAWCTGAFWGFLVTLIVGNLRFMSCIVDLHSPPTRAFELAESPIECMSSFVPAFPFRHGIRLNRVNSLSRVSALPRFPTEWALCFRLQKPEFTRVSVHSKASATTTTPHSFFFHAKLRPVPAPSIRRWMSTILETRHLSKKLHLSKRWTTATSTLETGWTT